MQLHCFLLLLVFLIFWLPVDMHPKKCIFSHSSSVTFLLVVIPAWGRGSRENQKPSAGWTPSGDLLRSHNLGFSSLTCPTSWFVFQVKKSTIWGRRERFLFGDLTEPLSQATSQSHTGVPAYRRLITGAIHRVQLGRHSSEWPWVCGEALEYSSTAFGNTRFLDFQKCSWTSAVGVWTSDVHGRV